MHILSKQSNNIVRVLTETNIVSLFWYIILLCVYNKIIASTLGSRQMCSQARGIDIPMLDNVINYNFPSKSKLFVHRVGCVARAGRSGTAYSFVAPDEVPYVLDLHLFLGRSLKLSTKSDEGGVQDGLLGSVPQRIIDEEEEYIRHVVETSPDLVSVYCGPHTVLDCALVCTYMHTYIHTACPRVGAVGKLVPGWGSGCLSLRTRSILSFGSAMESSKQTSGITPLMLILIICQTWKLTDSNTGCMSRADVIIDPK